MNKKEKEIKELFENLDEKGQDILEMVAKGMVLSQNINKEDK